MLYSDITYLYCLAQLQVKSHNTNTADPMSHIIELIHDWGNFIIRATRRGRRQSRGGRNALSSWCINVHSCVFCINWEITTFSHFTNWAWSSLRSEGVAYPTHPRGHAMEKSNRSLPVSKILLEDPKGPGKFFRTRIYNS